MSFTEKEIECISLLIIITIASLLYFIQAAPSVDICSDPTVVESLCADSCSLGQQSMYTVAVLEQEPDRKCNLLL